MAKDVKVNLAGVRQVLCSRGVGSLMAEEASKVERQANALYGLGTAPRLAPYASGTSPRETGTVGRVWTATKLGRIDNAHANTLLKAMG